MNQVNPSEAAFEGFRLLRREPATGAVWGLCAAALSVVMLGLMKGTGYMDSLAQMTNPAAAANPMRALGGLAAFSSLAMVISVAVYAVVVCAVYRAVLRPGEKGPGRLRLGGDEARMIGLFLIMLLLWLAACIVFAIIGGVLAFAVAGGRAGGGGGVGGAIGLILLIYLVFFVFAIWFAVQFSMAAPMTFAERRISVFRSWKLVRGNFWRLLGCFVLVAIFTILVGIGISIVQMLLFGLVGAPTTFSALSHPGVPPDMNRFLTPGALIANAVVAFIGSIFYAIWFAPQAAAYRDIVGVTGERAAEVFG